MNNPKLANHRSNAIDPTILLLIALFFSAILSRNAGAATLSWGTPLGQFNGVWNYSDDLATMPSPQPANYIDGHYMGLEWECVEYVRRYYYSTYQMDLYYLGGGMDAHQFYGNAANMHLAAYANGGPAAPQVGDILCFGETTPGNLGHVAIIRLVDQVNSALHVIQQNVKNGASSPYGYGTDDDWVFPYTTSGGHYTVDASSAQRLGSDYYCQGWLRSSGITSVTPVPASGAAATVGQTFPLSVNVGYSFAQGGYLQVWVYDQGLVASVMNGFATAGPQTGTAQINLNLPSRAAGLHGYTVYAQFRPGATSGPLLTCNIGDIVSSSGYALNWIDASGSLKVTISPPEAVTAGAAWQVDGTGLHVSGEVVGNLSPGQHVVSFQSVPGFSSPANSALNIVANQQTNVGGVYGALPPPGSVAAPTITPNGGTFAGWAQATLACSTPGASIYYTTDGSDPTPGTAATALYSSSPIMMNATFTLKAKAIETGYQDSAISSANFTITTPASPPNDHFTNSTTLLGMTATIAGSNTGATRDNDEPLMSNTIIWSSVWYSWTAPASGSVYFWPNCATCSGPSPRVILLGFYTGSQLTSLSQVAGTTLPAGDPVVWFTASAGTTYHIELGDEFIASSGDFTLYWQLTAGQTITFASLPDRTYGDAPLNLTATASSGLPVSFTVSGPATLSGAATLSLTGAGPVTVVASQGGGGGWQPAVPVTNTFTVAPAALLAKADDKSKGQGSPNPALTISYRGFVNGDYTNALSSAPTPTTSATTSSPPGVYPIVLSGGSADNYALTLQQGALTITPAPVPGQFGGAAVSNGIFTCTFSGTPGQAYVIWASSDLTNWVPTSTNTVPGSGSIILTQSIAPASHPQFYRTTVQ